MSDLSTLKVGDAVCVIVVTRGTSGVLSIFRKGVVEKITKTQITAFGGMRYMIRNGRALGTRDSWHTEYIQPLTDKIIARAEHGTRIRSAQMLCSRAAEMLNKARGDDAIRLAALLPPELKDATHD